MQQHVSVQLGSQPGGGRGSWGGGASKVRDKGSAWSWKAKRSSIMPSEAKKPLADCMLNLLIAVEAETQIFEAGRDPELLPPIAEDLTLVTLAEVVVELFRGL